jgi:hypothetical protein
MAVFAGFVAADRDARLGSKDGFLKLDGDVFAKIRATLNAATAAAAATERISESEELAKDFAEVLEHRGIETRAGSGRVTDASMAEAVIERALFGVGKNAVGLGNFLEALLRIRIVGIAVGMVLHGELAIGALEFNFGDGAGDAEHFVIVAFCVRGQN